MRHAGCFFIWKGKGGKKLGVGPAPVAGQLKLIGPVSKGPMTVTDSIVASLQTAGFSSGTHVKFAVKYTEMAQVL